MFQVDSFRAVQRRLETTVETVQRSVQRTVERSGPVRWLSSQSAEIKSALSVEPVRDRVERLGKGALQQALELRSELAKRSPGVPAFVTVNGMDVEFDRAEFNRYRRDSVRLFKWVRTEAERIARRNLPRPILLRLGLVKPSQVRRTKARAQAAQQTSVATGRKAAATRSRVKSKSK